MRDNFEPILGRSATAHTELERFTVVAQQGLGWASSAVEIHELMTRSRAFGDNPAAVDSHQKEAQSAEEFARKQLPVGFPYLWYLATVRLWTILEVMIEDVIRELLATSLHKVPAESPIYKLDGPLIPFLSLDTSSRAELLLWHLKDRVRAPLNPGVGRLEAILAPVGLGGSVPASIRRTVLELSQTRNLIVHKNGVVDQRFLDACPWVPCTLGNDLPATQSHFKLFGLAVDWYNLELGIRLDCLFGLVTKKEATALRELLEKRTGELLKMRPLNTVPSPVEPAASKKESATSAAQGDGA